MHSDTSCSDVGDGIVDVPGPGRRFGQHDAGVRNVQVLIDGSCSEGNKRVPRGHYHYTKMILSSTCDWSRHHHHTAVGLVKI